MQNAKPGRGKIYNSITETIGDTPLVRLPRLTDGISADLLYKLEFFNPGASVKDRIGLAMIEDMEAKGRLKKGGILIEPTSGNTGIGLALAAASKGYETIFTMPESMSEERRKLMQLLGAKIVLTPAAEGMMGAIHKAQALVKTTPGAVMPAQFDNPANAKAHYQSTGPEIWNDTEGRVDVLIAGVGTGGTLTGAGGDLKTKNRDLKIIALEPSGSPFLSKGEKGPHMIQGIGAGFTPSILDTNLIDEIMTIDNDLAFETARRAAREDGVPVGISSGAAIAASLQIGARPEMAGKHIVTIIPSFAERYLSTALFDFSEDS
ncbi:MAG TPA: cysteine synthase A [Hellea balneolensis]|uniref:Cysteine synthase n=1 Tax=Hellea balneolensis TaxID=287478 RepID=A0A7C5LSU1_9PROT|nr:cysteine synthase A [Hellea balneolensis]